MSINDFNTSLAHAEARLATAKLRQRSRADRGKMRISQVTITKLQELTCGYLQPRMTAIMQQLQDYCRLHHEKVPARATVYNALITLPTTQYKVATLPAEVRQALYNMNAESIVPGHQLAFYCLNYGNARAISFTASLPWLALYQAQRQRGWHKKSLGLLTAILRARRNL
ncbi:MAG: hypothetical protein JW841_07605 [Deltaproteobacteria bacterium]|nr:hypothetical protein [Deltaproteobacteria bacterium]